MIKVAIVEDDERDFLILRNFLEQYGKDGGEAFDICRFQNAFDFVSDYVPEYDIIFFDIEMPRMNGMEGARRIRKIDAGVAIVFVTNMAQYAVQGYEVDAIDFLVKPIIYTGFAEKLRRAINFSVGRRSTPVLVCTEEGAYIRILCSDVCYIEKDKNYVLYHCRDGHVYRKREQLHKVSEMFCKHGFAYINSGCIVNFFDIRQLTQTSLTVCGIELPLARRRRQEFVAEYMRWLGGRTGEGGNH